MNNTTDKQQVRKLERGDVTSFPFLSIAFQGNIPSGKLLDFRSAICSTLAKANYSNLHWYHNHDDEGNVFFRYPRVIYRTSPNGAEVIMIKEAVDGMAALPLISQGAPFYFGSNENSLILSGVNPKEAQIGVLPPGDFRYYRLAGWLPFNQENHRVWQGIEDPNGGEAEPMLRKILIGNILTLAKGVDVHIGEPIKIRNLTVTERDHVRIKEVPRHRFDVVFAVNMQLPIGLGLGKNVAFGYGRIAPGPKMPQVPVNLEEINNSGQE